MQQRCNRENTEYGKMHYFLAHTHIFKCIVALREGSIAFPVLRPVLNNNGYLSLFIPIIAFAASGLHCLSVLDH